MDFLHQLGQLGFSLSLVVCQHLLVFQFLNILGHLAFDYVGAFFIVDNLVHVMDGSTDEMGIDIDANHNHWVVQRSNLDRSRTIVTTNFEHLFLLEYALVAKVCPQKV